MAGLRQHQQRANFPPQTFAAPDTNAGIPWMVPWQPPHFAKKVPVQLQSTEFVALTPSTLPAPVSGIAWWKPFDQPKQVKVQIELQQTEFRVFGPPIAFTPEVLNSWYRGWEPPYFPKLTMVKLQQTEFRLFLPPITFTPEIFNSWYSGWVPPHFPKLVRSYLQQTSPAYGSVISLPAVISGMAWYQAFAQPIPKQIRVDYIRQQHFFWTSQIWRTNTSVRILGGAR